MRRSFGPGAGGPTGGGGGGSGGAGMIKTVHRAVRAGIGGAAAQEPIAHSAATAGNRNNSNAPTVNNLCISSSNSNTPPPFSNYTNHPIPAAAAAAKWVVPTSPTSSEEFEWECVDGGGFYDELVFGNVPSEEEVHHAVSSLQQVLDPVSFSHLIKDRFAYNLDTDTAEKITSPTSSHKSGREIDWIEPSLQICNSTNISQSPVPERVYDAFHMLQTEPSVQRMVISLSSDKAVWDAVMNNEVVRELRESVSEVEKSISESSDTGSDNSNPVTEVLRWIFVSAKTKVMEMIENITKTMNGLFQPKEKEKVKGEGEGGDTFDEKLRSSFMLSVMVLLIVVVNRACRS